MNEDVHMILQVPENLIENSRTGRKVKMIRFERNFDQKFMHDSKNLYST